VWIYIVAQSFDQLTGLVYQIPVQSMCFKDFSPYALDLFAYVSIVLYNMCMHVVLL